MDKRIVLLVEDNEKLNEINRRALENEGYEVLTARTLAAAREHLSRRDPDIILLDVVLPDGSGMDLCKKIRKSTNAHILFLTSRREHGEKLRGLSLGGDDYITKPFKLDELLMRVAAAMRRRKMTPKPTDGITIDAGELSLNTLTLRAYWRGVDLNLQTKEFAMLRYLMQKHGGYTTAENIYHELWGMDAVDTRVVRQVVYRLRKNLSLNGVGYSIEQKHGHGYRFTEDIEGGKKRRNIDKN